MTDDDLIACVETALHDLRARREDTRPFVVMPTDTPSVAPADEGDQRPDEARLVTPDPPPSPREVRCEFGCGSISRLRRVESDAPRRVANAHHNDPEVVKARDAEATRVMLAGGEGRLPWR